MIIKFLGAAREVTGSKHLIITDKGKKILLDCGMFQGKGLETDSMNRNLGFNPAEIDYLILSHAHIDHSGLIPYIHKLGFDGHIFCTHATRDLCSIMLADSGHIQEQDTVTFNKKRARKGLPPVEPIYTREDALACMDSFISLPYKKPFQLDENIKVSITNTGHLLGSGVINLEIKENGKTTRIAYTGDIGRPKNRILKSPQPFPQSDILIAESTYGDRLHEDSMLSEEKLLNVVNDTCVKKGGKLIIPSFSIGRAQEIIYSLNNFYNAEKLPKVDIYVDSPLAVNATNIFRMHRDCFNKDVLEVMETDPDPFGFNRLFYIMEVKDSKRLNDIKKPCIIISASGMMEAGRIKHHLVNSIENPNNTILVVGYCAPPTLGARILRGDKRVSIFGTEYSVNASVERIESYSGHGDYREMIDFLGCQDNSSLKNMYLVHGEHKAQLSYKATLENNGFSNIEIPARGDEVSL
ncbi:MAG: MBL fold metallo-hydrolase [Bacteroidales bacterium]|nr:MBL fold metallo-hydrolase [Bacteroidales bacterium]MBN2761980.1 MBL fold metallo-hydrolase [Bacteroidales bacterium]